MRAREQRPVERHVATLAALHQARTRCRQLRRDGVRGSAAQQPIRDLEERLRRRACALVRVGHSHGWRPGAIARSIGVDPDLVAGWERERAARLGRDAVSLQLVAKPLAFEGLV